MNQQARKKNTGVIPGWLRKQEKITTRQWKARKRAQIKAIDRAFREFRLGCAYTPGLCYNEVARIDTSIGVIKHELSVKNWGR